MSNIVKRKAAREEATFEIDRVEYSYSDGSAVQKTVTMEA